MLRDVRLVAVNLALFLGVLACGRSDDRGSTRAPTPPGDATPATAASAVDTASRGLKMLNNIELGRAVDAGNLISDSTVVFIPRDTVWASVVIDGTARSAILQARWTARDGQVIEESAQSIVPSGRTVAAFKCLPADAWPAGRYQLTVLLNGVYLATKDFEVQP